MDYSFDVVALSEIELVDNSGGEINFSFGFKEVWDAGKEFGAAVYNFFAK